VPCWNLLELSPRRCREYPCNLSGLLISFFRGLSILTWGCCSEPGALGERNLGSNIQQLCASDHTTVTMNEPSYVHIPIYQHLLNSNFVGCILAGGSDQITRRLPEGWGGYSNAKQG
jgi:hypothetical protein